MEEILQELRRQGIIIDQDEEPSCIFAISHYWIFRLQPYINIFLHDQAPFHFTEVLRLYELDKKLRTIIGDFIQMIEIDFKAKLVTNTLTIPRNAFELPQERFTQTGYREIEGILAEAIRNLMMHENDLRNRQNTNFQDIVRVASFGDMYKIFNTLSFEIKEAIIQDYQVQGHSVDRVATWIRAIRKMRNIRAHHDICVRNPDRLSNISLEPNLNGNKLLFSYLKVFIFLGRRINDEYTDDLIEQCITLIADWIDKFPFFQRIINAPRNRRQILHNENLTN